MARIILLLIGPALALGLYASRAQARTLTVDCEGTGEFTTIQAAVDAAVTGDILEIAPCTYEESVVAGPKILTFRGSEPGATILWSEPGYVLHGETSMTVEGLTLEKSPSELSAVHLDDNHLIMSDCRVTGGILVTGGHGSVHLENVTATSLSVSGAIKQSTIRDSHFLTAGFSGIWMQGRNLYESFNSSYGILGFGALTWFSSHGDSIGMVQVDGYIDIDNEFLAEDSYIGMCRAAGAPRMSLTTCTVSSLIYEEAFGYYALQVTGCLLRGECTVAFYGPPSAPKGGSGPSQDFSGLVLEHNTMLGPLDLRLGSWILPEPPRFRSNIVIGPANIASNGGFPQVTHNDFVGELTTAFLGTFQNNLEGQDPQFCAPELDAYTIRNTSPCVGQAHDGADIGALGIGCSDVPVLPTTWGSLKRRYR